MLQRSFFTWRNDMERHKICNAFLQRLLIKSSMRLISITFAAWRNGFTKSSIAFNRAWKHIQWRLRQRQLRKMVFAWSRCLEIKRLRQYAFLLVNGKYVKRAQSRILHVLRINAKNNQFMRSVVCRLARLRCARAWSKWYKECRKSAQIEAVEDCMWSQSQISYQFAQRSRKTTNFKLKIKSFHQWTTFLQEKLHLCSLSRLCSVIYNKNLSRKCFRHWSSETRTKISTSFNRKHRMHLLIKLMRTQYRSHLTKAFG